MLSYYQCLQFNVIGNQNCNSQQKPHLSYFTNTSMYLNILCCFHLSFDFCEYYRVKTIDLVYFIPKYCIYIITMNILKYINCENNIG